MSIYITFPFYIWNLSQILFSYPTITVQTFCTFCTYSVEWNRHKLQIFIFLQVVQRIKAVEDETRLLLIDNEAEVYYKQNDIVVSGEMENVL